MFTGRFGIAVLGILLTIGVAPVRAGDVSMYGSSKFPQQDGAALYQAICQGCHQPNAEGAIGAAAYPALAQNKKLASAAYPIYTVLQGRKGMPPLASYLGHAQIAEQVTYVRTGLGTNHPN